MTGIGHIHRQTGREAERQRDGECSVEREVVFGISLVRDQKQPQMSSSSHSVSASDGSRCVAGARLSWSSCFVFRTCEMHVVRDAESEGTLSTMGMS